MDNNTAEAPVLALFDIDGTILSSGAGARKSLSQAIHEITGTLFEIHPDDCAGKTDPLIITNFLRRAGFHPREFHGMLRTIRDRYVALLHVNYNKHNDAFLYPGIPEILHEIGGYSHVYLGLLTGNIEEGARIKLDPFRLNPMFPAGAFGNEGMQRTDLSRLAVESAEAHYNIRFEPARIVVIGDTADDVACGKVIHARSIAVSRRPATLERLKSSQPDYLFYGTEDTEGFVKAILDSN